MLKSVRFSLSLDHQDIVSYYVSRLEWDRRKRGGGTIKLPLILCLNTKVLKNVRFSLLPVFQDIVYNYVSRPEGR